MIDLRVRTKKRQPQRQPSQISIIKQLLRQSQMMKELNSNYLLQEEAEMIASQRKSKFFEKISLICSLRQAQEIQYLGTQAQTR
jgi:hypothetical protein